MDVADAQDEMQRIRKRLGDFYSPPEILLWLRSPHPQLGGRKAVDAVMAGEANKVHAILDRLNSDGYV